MKNGPREFLMDDPIFTEALALLRQGIDAVHDLTPKEYPQIPAIEFTATKMMWQSISRCEAVHLLLTEGHLDEATILLRSLMWDAQRLIYMDQNPDDRIALLLGLGNKQTHNMEALVRIAEELELDAEIFRQEVINRRQQLERARSARGVGELKRFPSEGIDIARSIGKLNDMLGHQMYSANTHSAALSIFTNVSITEDGTVNLTSRNKAPRYVSGAARSAVEHLFDGAIATAKAQEWKTVDELRRCYKEIDGNFERLLERTGQPEE